MSGPASHRPTLSLKRPPASPSATAPKSAPQVKPKPSNVAPSEMAMLPAAERRFTVRLDKWTPCVRRALKGFARISVEELGLRIDGIAVSQRADGW